MYNNKLVSKKESQSTNNTSSLSLASSEDIFTFFGENKTDNKYRNSNKK